MPDFCAGQLLRIFIDHDDRWHGRPLYTAIVEMLRKNKIAGATVFDAIEGYGAHDEVHVAKIFSRAKLPVLIEVVDDPDAIARIMPSLNAMLSEGMVTLEQVRYVRFEASGGS